MQQVWLDFCEIIEGANFNGMTQPAISWQDLRAWCDLTKTDLEPWHARALVRLAAVRANILSEKAADASRDKGRADR